MAVPKSKITRSKRGMRRAHDSLKAVNVVECPNCGEQKSLIIFVKRVVTMVIRRLHQ